MSEEDKDELVHIEVGEEELFADICRVVSDYRRQMEASQSLTYTKPEKAANALYRWSTGWSPTKIRKKLGVQPVSLRNMLVDFAIHADKWQELGAKISSRSWVRMGMLEDEVLEKLEDQVESGEIKPTFLDLKNLSIAKGASHREASLAMGHATSITEKRDGVTQDDYEETRRKILERMENAIEVEEVES